MQAKLFVAISAIFIAFTRHVNVVDGLVCVGCIELDKLTFDKILAKFSIVLVKFDIAFPYGKKHDEYAKFALEISEDGEEAMDVAVSVVGIKNYGDKTNNELIDRFSIGDKLPVIKLFTNYNAKEWLDFPKGANSHTDYFSPFIFYTFEFFLYFSVGFVRSKYNGKQFASVCATAHEFEYCR